MKWIAGLGLPENYQDFSYYLPTVAPNQGSRHISQKQRPSHGGIPLLPSPSRVLLLSLVSVPYSQYLPSAVAGSKSGRSNFGVWCDRVMLGEDWAVPTNWLLELSNGTASPNLTCIGKLLCVSGCVVEISIRGPQITDLTRRRNCSRPSYDRDGARLHYER